MATAAQQSAREQYRSAQAQAKQLAAAQLAAARGRDTVEVFGQVLEEPREGLITLAARAGNERSQLTFVLGADPDLQPTGIGGFEASARPGLPPARWYSTPGDGSLSIDVAIDVRLVGGPDMDRRLAVLATMGRRNRTTGEPPKLQIVGGHLPLATGMWVIKTGGIGLGDRVILSGQHVRQQISIDLEPFEKVDPIAPLRPGRTRPSLNTGRRRQVTARKGDTLRVIGSRELGSAGAYKQLWEWNPKLKKTDPDTVLKAGTHVVIR